MFVPSSSSSAPRMVNSKTTFDSPSSSQSKLIFITLSRFLIVSPRRIRLLTRMEFLYEKGPAGITGAGQRCKESLSAPFRRIRPGAAPPHSPPAEGDQPPATMRARVVARLGGLRARLACQLRGLRHFGTGGS